MEVTGYNHFSPYEKINDKKNQDQLPYYWVFHNKSEDDVLIQTAAKDLQTSQNLAMELFPKEFEEWVEWEGGWEFALFSINSNTVKL